MPEQSRAVRRVTHRLLRGVLAKRRQKVASKCVARDVLFAVDTRRPPQPLVNLVPA